MEDVVLHTAFGEVDSVNLTLGLQEFQFHITANLIGVEQFEGRIFWEMSRR